MNCDQPARCVEFGDGRGYSLIIDVGNNNARALAQEAASQLQANAGSTAGVTIARFIRGLR